MENQIVLTAKTVASSSVEFKAELATLLGFTLEPLVVPDDDEEDGEYEYAELGLQAARAFLHGCGDKTQGVIAAMVAHDQTFSVRALEKQVGVGEGELRGVWAGLTKRTRTITGDNEAELIEWGDQDEDGDYEGKLHPTTRKAFRAALNEE